MDWAFVFLCLLIMGYLGWRIRQNSRRLRERIEAYLEEQEKNPTDPYTAMNELYQMQQQDEKKP